MSKIENLDVIEDNPNWKWTKYKCTFCNYGCSDYRKPVKKEDNNYYCGVRRNDCIIPKMYQMLENMLILNEWNSLSKRLEELNERYG
jgi:hypothetical protein